MNISIFSINPPPVDKPFRVFFTGGGFLTRDGRLTYDFHSAMIFYSADEFNSLDQEIYYRLVYDVIGPLNSDSFFVLSSFKANIFVQFI